MLCSRFAPFPHLHAPLVPSVYCSSRIKRLGHEAIRPSTGLLTEEVCIVSVKRHPRKVLLRSPHPCSICQFPISRQRGPYPSSAPSRVCSKSRMSRPGPLSATRDSHCSRFDCCGTSRTSYPGFSAPHYEYETSLKSLHEICQIVNYLPDPCLHDLDGASQARTPVA